jgi:hypothetical protein
MPLAFTKPSVNTSTHWTVENPEQSTGVLSKARRAIKCTYYRETQAQGDCFYLCLIGALQTEDPDCREAHLDRFRDFATRYEVGDVEGYIRKWGVLNVFRPEPNPRVAPLVECSILRRVFAKYFLEHAGYYMGEEGHKDELSTDPPLWMKLRGASPKATEFRGSIKQEVVQVSAHFQCWKGGQPVDLDDDDAVKKAYSNKIQGLYPDGAKIEENVMTPAQMGSFGADTADEKILRYSATVETHIASQIFGVILNLYVWLDSDATPTWESARLTVGMTSSTLVAPFINKQTPWLLLCKGGEHYDFFETSKWTSIKNKTTKRSSGNWMRAGKGGSGGEDTIGQGGTGGGGGRGGWGEGSGYALAVANGIDASGKGGPAGEATNWLEVGEFVNKYGQEISEAQARGHVDGPGGKPPGGSSGGGGSGGITINDTPPPLNEAEVLQKAFEEATVWATVQLQQLRDLVGRFVDEVEKRVTEKPQITRAEIIKSYIVEHNGRATKNQGTTATQWATLYLVTIQEMPLDPKMTRPELGRAMGARFTGNLRDGGGFVQLAIAMVQDRLDKHRDKKPRS